MEGCSVILIAGAFSWAYSNCFTPFYPVKSMLIVFLLGKNLNTESILLVLKPSITLIDLVDLVVKELNIYWGKATDKLYSS